MMKWQKLVISVAANNRGHFLTLYLRTETYNDHLQETVDLNIENQANTREPWLNV